MFWWIKPLLLSLAVLFLMDGILCAFLTAIDEKSKIIEFFMNTLFALFSMISIFLVIAIIYEIWMNAIPA